MHTIDIQLRFNDIDQMGHVNNAVIMEYFDLAKSHYFKAAGIPVTPDEGNFCVMIVHLECDFQRQIKFHDKVQVTTCTSRLGNKSLELTQTVLVEGQTAVVCKTILAGYSRCDAASAPIPEPLKEQVRQYDLTH